MWGGDRGREMQVYVTGECLREPSDPKTESVKGPHIYWAVEVGVRLAPLRSVPDDAS